MFPAVFLLAAIVILRLAPWLSGPEAVVAFTGFTPLMGYALCGGVFLPRRLALWFPLLAVVLTHGIINTLDGRPFIHRDGLVDVAAVVIVSAVGIAVKKKASAAVLFGTCFASTVLFYLVSNTVSFFNQINPAYVKTAAGWWQALTTGMPQFSPPSWVFLVRELIGDLSFTALFYAAFRQSQRQPGTLPAATPVLAA
jgi:hypothetical protein